MLNKKIIVHLKTIALIFIGFVIIYLFALACIWIKNNFPYWLEPYIIPAVFFIMLYCYIYRLLKKL